ncbi:hypothetical protein MTYM_01753 [Methylococcales bacterium]|nr:hypothetical protein MTYM_01753 [Methylococcales bacterium]
MAIWDRKKENQGSKWDKWIGDKIRVAREEKNWTQGDLAKEVYAKQPRISDFERGAVEIGVVELAYIALALEKPITFFIPPKFNGATPNDLTDTQKEIIYHSSQASEEMELALLEQAKTYAKISKRAAEQKHREEMVLLRAEMEESKKAKKAQGKK